MHPSAAHSLCVRLFLLYQYLFNGDYVDRGPQGVEVALVIFAYKLLLPKFIFVNRGNHEDRDVNIVYVGHSADAPRTSPPTWSSRLTNLASHCARLQGFQEEIFHKYANLTGSDAQPDVGVVTRIFDAFTDAFNALPLAHVVNNKVG